MGYGCSWQELDVSSESCPMFSSQWAIDVTLRALDQCSEGFRTHSKNLLSLTQAIQLPKIITSYVKFSVESYERRDRKRMEKLEKRYKKGRGLQMKSFKLCAVVF